ncbi:glutaminase [uncultured Sphingomonas sp.]|uniref:glutaminase n=1 Tax=uncultured Sphingomonas sp. TaxID=158754 RepID=UPI0025F9871E|nr:glutaminase [uncultured Sphingomonas sp.]
MLCAIGDEIFERVGREPSGDPFNLIVDLERTDGIPRNPFVNAGALVTVDALITSFKRQRLKTRLMQVKHQKKRNFSASTFACGSRNRSLR